MGISTSLWRARIGAFNSITVFKDKEKCRVVNPWLVDYLTFMIHFMQWLFGICMVLLCPRMFISILSLFVIVVLLWTMLLFLYACIQVTSSVYHFRSSPVFIITVCTLPVLIAMFDPSIPLLVASFFKNPNLCINLLLLCGDIHPNPGPPDKGLSIWFTNINSLSAEEGERFSELDLRMKMNDIEIVCLSEVGSNQNLSKFGVDGYHSLSNDLYKPKGRGLLMYIKESLSFRRLVDLETDDSMWCEVRSRHHTALVGLFYRSPSQSTVAMNQYFSKLDDTLSTVMKQKCDIVVFGGDFNARSRFFWEDDTNTTEGNLLYDLTVKHSIYEGIHEPTRITDKSQSCIDLIFYNYPGYVINTEVDAPISFSDHCVTSVSLNLLGTVPSVTGHKRIWKFGQANMETLNHAVSEFDWDTIFVSDDPETICVGFVEALSSIFHDHIPHFDKNIKPKDMPWFKKDIKTAINKRSKLYQRMVKSKTRPNLNAFNDCSRRVRNLVKTAKNNYHEKLCNSLNTNNSGLKNYWHILKQLLGKKVNSGFPTLSYGNDVLVDDKDKANCFLSQFSLRFHHKFDQTIRPNFLPKTDTVIDGIVVNSVTIRKLLLSLDTSKQGGVDGISNRMLRAVACTLDIHLCRLFNKLLHVGYFPRIWKLGIVVPIFKNKGTKCSPANYRPVTLLNSLSKIFERTVYTVLLEHLQAENIIFERQSGFLPGHDAQKQLLDMVNGMLKNFENKTCTRGVFLDVSGAFDSVPHYLLIDKLWGYGIRGSLLEFLKSYLDGRQIKVRVNNSLSDVTEDGYINCGVPQGSILGPLLFLIYINDICEVVHNCRLYIYADDCSLFLPVGYQEDPLLSTRLLQEDLNRIFEWSNTWKLNFKAEKSNEVVFYPSRLVKPRFPDLLLGRDSIPLSTSHKHLGVLLDEKLTFEKHITNIVVKCNSLLNPLASLKHSIQSKHLEKLYFSFVLPHLEYGSLIFTSANAGILAKLDQVHYRAALIVSGCIKGTSRVKVFRCLDWMSLEERRNEKKLVLMFDVENDSVPDYVANNFIEFRNPVLDERLRNICPYRLPARVSQRFSKSTVPTCIKLWNGLPNEIRQSFSRNSFKYRVRLHINGCKNPLVTTRLNISRKKEISLNRTRCDLVFRTHYFNHNFASINDPHCRCGHRSQTTKHVLFNCPLLCNERKLLFDSLGLLPTFHTLYRDLTSSGDRLQCLLYGSQNLSISVNRLITEHVSEFLTSCRTTLSFQ